MTSLCANCGFDNPPGMRFCGNCGTRLGEATSSAPAKTGPLSLEPASTTAFVPEDMGVMMGADLMERMRKAGIEAAGQRRIVTVLFTDLSGYTSLSEKMDQEDLYELVQGFIHEMINEVYKYEGIVDKLTGDGLMALFGAPIAHENNAERAVRAALDMQADVVKMSRKLKEEHGYEISMRVGLHSGIVVVGGIGSDLLMNYTAIGDTVNLAHRIMEAAAPGTILVSEPVYRQVRALFDLQQISMLNPKGITRPVPAFRVVNLKEKPGLVRGVEGLRAPMIGRERELNELKAALGALTSRRKGQLALILGEAGLGKSRLTREFRSALEGQPVRILEGQSVAYRKSLSYWIFLDMLANFLGVTARTPAEQVRDRLAQTLFQAMGGAAVETLPYFEYLMSLHISDPAAAQRMQYLDAGQLRQQIFLAARNLFLAEARRQPLLLIFEDLHWADETSLELLSFLAESLNQAPIFILGISRFISNGPMQKGIDYAQQHFPAQYHCIQLQNLSPAQTERLMLELLAIPEMPGGLQQKILERSGGVPFYLEEILRMLIDKGAIYREADHWRAVPGMEAVFQNVPDSLEGLILARFDRLDPLQRRVLQVASVIGKSFGLPLLEQVMRALSSEDIDPAVVELAEREFILPTPGEPAADYSFRHVLMTEAIYNTMLRKERAGLHGQVGDALETLQGGRTESQVELLARHYSRSPRLEKALHYLILAGQKAARGYANAQAQSAFEEALELLPKIGHSPSQEVEVYLGLGDIGVLTGEYVKARMYYQRALESNRADGSAAGISLERSSVLRRIGATLERQGEYDSALEALTAAESQLQGIGPEACVEHARILNDTGWIHFRRGNPDQAEQLLKDALALLDGGDRYDVIASIYNRLGGVYYQKDNLDMAANYVQKSLALREAIGDVVAVARSYNNLGLIGWKIGRWDSAVENLNRSVELHANLGDVEGMIELHANLGLLQLDRGNLFDSRKHIEESLEKASQIGHSYHIGLNYLYLSRLYLQTEDWNTAGEYAQRAMQVFENLGGSDHLVDVYTNLGSAALGNGDLESAGSWAERALELFASLDQGQNRADVESRARALRLLGKVHLGEGDFSRAEPCLKESAAIFAQTGSQLENGRSAIALADLENARRNVAGARILTGEARVIFRQLGANLDLQRIETGSSARIFQ
jgi:predicted ATPase/class 3 adenylate cyclase